MKLGFNSDEAILTTCMCINNRSLSDAPHHSSSRVISLLSVSMKIHLRPQLSDINAAALRRKMISISPLCVHELRAINHDLGQLDSRAGMDPGSNNIDPRAESEYKTGILPIEHKVSAGQQDFARCRYGDGGAVARHAGSQSLNHSEEVEGFNV